MIRVQLLEWDDQCSEPQFHIYLHCCLCCSTKHQWKIEYASCLWNLWYHLHRSSVGDHWNLYQTRDSLGMCLHQKDHNLLAWMSNWLVLQGSWEKCCRYRSYCWILFSIVAWREKSGWVIMWSNTTSSSTFDLSLKEQRRWWPSLCCKNTINSEFVWTIDMAIIVFMHFAVYFILVLLEGSFHSAHYQDGCVPSTWLTSYHTPWNAWVAHRVRR